MDSTIQLVISLLLAMGFGSILGAYFQSRFQHQKDIDKDLHTLKVKRYGSILIQMLTIIEPKNLHKVQQFREDFKTIDNVKEEVRTEMLNCIVFADDRVIKAIIEFNSNPSYSSYIKTVVAMRKDLWGNKTSIDEQTLNILTK